MAENRYCDYLDIDDRYYPCIDEAAINNGAPWDNTYPHSTFINMLKETERALSRLNNGKSIWIEGAYGTGKSQCAYALRKILESPESEVRDYWESYGPLKKQSDLLEKLISHKNKGIAVAWRYASGDIMSPRDLFFAVQESVKTALINYGASYMGENTLKESIIAWLEDQDHKTMFDSLLQNHNKEWGTLFSQSDSEEVLEALRKNGEIKSLVNNIFRLADKEGITALTINADRLIAWLTDIIDKNNIKIVLIWDEFSDYFRNNRESLSEFQKIVSLVQDKPFYFIIVTHQSKGIYLKDNDKTNRSKVSDRFVSVEITLPDNIAFDLIGDALKVKKSASDRWKKLVEENLCGETAGSRAAVMASSQIDDPRALTKMMPIHPMAALVLKNIAYAFQSNQRSMFDFIKSSDTEKLQSFQWFINTFGPLDNYPLLTVDMLWNFFYEKGRDNLTPEIRAILDIFPQQRNLSEDEEKILKTILIMQAVNNNYRNAIDLFKTTEKNLSYVFEGVSCMEGTKPASLANELKKKGILITEPLENGKVCYMAAVLAGDQSKIDDYKKTIRQTSSTAKLVTDGGLTDVLELSPALRLRFESEPGTGKIIAVTKDDFNREISKISAREAGWKFHAVIAFAKDEDEAIRFREVIKEKAADKQYENITFIDALSTPLGEDAFEEYVDFSARAAYHQSKDNASAREFADKAKNVLAQNWKNIIKSGPFIVYTYAFQDGEKLNNARSVEYILETIVKKKFPYSFEFSKNLTESQLKLHQTRQAAKAGITRSTAGAVKDLEKHVLTEVWAAEKYWENPATSSLPVSVIKTETDQRIKNVLNDGDQISIGEIWDFLEKKYGFAPCALYAFITGFLLKEYAGEPYRYGDSSGYYGSMTQEKLAEMIGDYAGKSSGRSPKPAYIVKMTPEEKAFYDLTEKAWGIERDSYSSVSQAVAEITSKMKRMGLPVWCLEETDSEGVFGTVIRYAELIRSEGREAYKKAIEIGEISQRDRTLGEKLASLVTDENCQNAMRKFLLRFEDGSIPKLANAIGAEDRMIIDIRRIFEVKYASLWDRETGEDEIRGLIVEYGIVAETNEILRVSARSLTEAYGEWRERLKFIGISCETLGKKYPSLKRIFDTLLGIVNNEMILPERLKVFRTELASSGAELKNLLENDEQVFAEVYAPYLEELDKNETAGIKSRLKTDMFKLSGTECNKIVKEAAEEYRKNRLKSRLSGLWFEKTGTKTPREWSQLHRTPVLCCVSEAEYENSKKAFEIINNNSGSDTEVREAKEFLESAEFFSILSDESEINSAFDREIIGSYGAILQDREKVRNALRNISIEVYEWRDHPSVKNKVKQLAEAEYNAGGSDTVIMKIDGMDGESLKRYLKKLVKTNVTVGMEILAGEGGE